MATTTLRPSGAGNETNWTPNGVATNHGCVNEVSVDNDTTYNNFPGNGANKRDLYVIDANSIGASDTINSITVYMVARMVTSGRLISVVVAPVIRENGTTTQGTGQNLSTTSYVTKSQTWTTKPSSGTAFTRTDITNLEIGIYASQSDSNNCRCTQAYVIVDYTAAGGGSIPNKIFKPRQAINRASTY